MAFVAGAGRASAQYGGWVEPRWNYQGSAVCPERYDFDDGWCKPRGAGYYGEGGGSPALPPRWTPDGSAVCPSGYDYLSGACRRRSPEFEYGAIPPRWNRAGQAVCPQYHDFIGGMCRPRG
ncbi:MAG TPA: hypothetical protein VHN20_05375 [Beijerinckiaceae bacterium]|nr:hypothetical protein [Beijerinckiaceae bacterium]